MTVRSVHSRAAEEDDGSEYRAHRGGEYHVSHNARPQNTLPVQLPAPASQQWLGGSSIISYAPVSVLLSGGYGDTGVDTVNTEPHLEALLHHVAECLGGSRPRLLI